MNLTRSPGVTACGLVAGGWAGKRRLEFLPRGLKGALPTRWPWFMAIQHSRLPALGPLSPSLGLELILR